MSRYEVSPLISFDLNGKTYELQEKNMKACAVFNPIFEPEPATTGSDSRLRLDYDFGSYKKYDNMIMNMAFDIISGEYTKTLLLTGSSGKLYYDHLLIPLFAFCDYLGVDEKIMGVFLYWTSKIHTSIALNFYLMVFEEKFVFSESVRMIHNLFSKGPNDTYVMKGLELKNLTHMGVNQTIPLDFKRLVMSKMIDHIIGGSLDELMLALNTRKDTIYYNSAVGFQFKYSTENTIRKSIWYILDEFQTLSRTREVELIFDLSQTEADMYLPRSGSCPSGIPIAIKLDNQSLLVPDKKFRQTLIEYLISLFLKEDIAYGTYEAIGTMDTYKVERVPFYDQVVAKKLK